MDVEVAPAAKTTLICAGSIVTLGVIFVHAESVGSKVTPICEVALVAARKMSCWRPPCGAMEGEMPLKVMSPALTMVTAACAMRALSTFEKA